MSVSSDRDDPDAGSTGKTDRGARRHHTPRALSHIPEREFRRAALQEPLEDWEYAIPLEEPNGQEIMGVEDREMVEKPGGEAQGFPDPQHPQPEAQAERPSKHPLGASHIPHSPMHPRPHPQDPDATNC